MNIQIKLLCLCLGLGLCYGVPLRANEVNTHPAPSLVRPPAAAAVPQARTGKTGGRASRKPYSKATLSAFQPIDASKVQPPPDENAAAAPGEAALSPVLRHDKADSDPLRQPLPLADEAARNPPFAMVPQDGGLLDKNEAEEVTEPDAAANEGATAPAPVADSAVLGQETQSVIDRNTDKPKTQPIARGPLRVRVKDKALRATVQIPLERKP